MFKDLAAHGRKSTLICLVHMTLHSLAYLSKAPPALALYPLASAPSALITLIPSPSSTLTARCCSLCLESPRLSLSLPCHKPPTATACPNPSGLTRFCLSNKPSRSPGIIFPPPPRQLQWEAYDREGREKGEGIPGRGNSIEQSE